MNSRKIELRRRRARGIFSVAALALLIVGTSGCGALLLVGGAGSSAIAFATGELRAEELVSLASLDAACVTALERLAYEEVTAQRDADRIRFRARTMGGEPVDLRLIARAPERTDIRIRIGTFGDEPASRLVLEEIHQSL